MSSFSSATWGRLFGWNRVPVRALVLFYGGLATAWTYRLGTDYLSRRLRFLSVASWRGDRRFSYQYKLVAEI